MNRSRRSGAPLRLGLALAVALSAVALTTQPGSAAPAGVYYVSPSGSDAADGSVLAPWRSIQKATSSAPAGAVILVAGGTYGPFAVTRPGQTVAAQPGQPVVVQGRAGVRDVVLLAASGATLDGVTVTGCVPDPAPAGAFEDAASGAIRIDDGTTGVLVHGVAVRNSRGTNGYGLPFGCYGVLAHHADAFRVVSSDISGTGTGIFVNGGGLQAVIADNRIHDNDVIIRNTPGHDDDYGGNGITFDNLPATSGVLATHNTITGNAGPSSDYGYDGGAFEIYNSSNVHMVANTIADNENVLETGTSPEGDDLLGDCVGNTFSGNQVTGRVAGSRLQRSIGLILRCATGMTVDDNSFGGLDWYDFDIFTDDKFSSDVDGLALTHNTVDQQQKVYQLRLDPTADRVLIEANRIHFTGTTFADYADGSTSATLADWQVRTGEDRLTTTY